MAELWLSNPRRRRKHNKRNPKRRLHAKGAYRKRNRRRSNPRHLVMNPRRHYRRHNPRRHRSYRRHNPPIMTDLLDAVKASVGFIGTGIIAPKVSTMLGGTIGTGTATTTIVKLLVAWLGGNVIARFKPDWGSLFTIGGMLSVIEPLIASKFALGEYTYQDPNLYPFTPGISVPFSSMPIQPGVAGPSMITTGSPAHDRTMSIADFGWLPDRLASRFTA